MIETDGHFPGICLAQEDVRVIPGERIAHWEMTGAIYHVALHLADSVPTMQLIEWREARRRMQSLRVAHKTAVLTDDEVAELHRVYDEKVEKYLSAGHGCCALREPQIADAVGRILESRHMMDYALHLWTVMPNHLHVIVSPLAGKSMKEIVAQWKSVSAHLLAKRSGMKAPIWQRDHYSRIIRTSDEYQRQVSYVWYNPESSGLMTGFLRKRYDD